MVVSLAMLQKVLALAVHGTKNKGDGIHHLFTFTTALTSASLIYIVVIVLWLERGIMPEPDTTPESEDEKRFRLEHESIPEEELSRVGISFLRFMDRIRREFEGVVGFSLDQGTMAFLVDDTVDEETKARIREEVVRFESLERTLEQLNEEHDASLCENCAVHAVEDFLSEDSE